MSISMTWPQYLRGECTLNGRHRIHLTKQEAEILSVLLIRRNLQTSVELLIDVLWPDPDNSPECADDMVRTLIVRLRKKIGRYNIATRITFGYALSQNPAGAS